MKNAFRRRDGFTLVELIVVIAVLIILIAVAVPAYLAVRDNAKDSGVKSDLAVAYKNARVVLAANADAWPDSLETTGGDGSGLLNQIRSAEPGSNFLPAPAGKVVMSDVADGAADDELVITDSGAAGSNFGKAGHVDPEAGFAGSLAEGTTYVWLDEADESDTVALILAGKSATGDVFYIVHGDQDEYTAQSWLPDDEGSPSAPPPPDSDLDLKASMDTVMNHLRTQYPFPNMMPNNATAPSIASFINSQLSGTGHSAELTFMASSGQVLPVSSSPYNANSFSINWSALEEDWSNFGVKGSHVFFEEHPTVGTGFLNGSLSDIDPNRIWVHVDSRSNNLVDADFLIFARGYDGSLLYTMYTHLGGGLLYKSWE